MQNSETNVSCQDSPVSITTMLWPNNRRIGVTFKAETNDP
jgi:hypothetical protein